MKKLFIAFAVVLLFLSSCVYTPQDIDDMQQAWDEKYYALEDEYSNLYSSYESVLSELSKTETFRNIVDDYFENNNSVPDDVLSAWDELSIVLGEYY